MVRLPGPKQAPKRRAVLAGDLYDSLRCRRKGRIGMQVKDIMTDQVITISQEETAAVAARLLSRHNIGALPVCTAEGKLRGLVTDRDIVLRCVAADENPHTTKISEIMSRRIVSVKPEDQAKTAADLMAKEQIRRLPVERDGKVVGMVSLADMATTPNFTMEAGSALTEISLNVKRK